jgi:SAM-dependent methyltransferase
MTAKKRYWTQRLFIDHGELFAQVLEAGAAAGRREARAVRKLFDREGISRKGRVVDIACGIGRHVVPLAQLGYDTVGCDFSPQYLARAQARAGAASFPGRPPRFYHSDYRRIDRTLRAAHERAFDAAVCIFTSMGHYGEEGDLAVLRAVRRIVRPGGIFVMEMGNRDWILSHFRPIGVMRPNAKLTIREKRRFDWPSSTVLCDWDFYLGHGKRRRKVYSQEVNVRQYSVHELKRLLERAGWDYAGAYGDLTRLSAFGFDSHRLVIVGRRPKI